jgi:hypothetical protein
MAWERFSNSKQSVELSSNYLNIKSHKVHARTFKISRPFQILESSRTDRWGLGWMRARIRVSLHSHPHPQWCTLDVGSQSVTYMRHLTWWIIILFEQCLTLPAFSWTMTKNWSIEKDLKSSFFGHKKNGRWERFQNFKSVEHRCLPACRFSQADHPQLCFHGWSLGDMVLFWTAPNVLVKK